MKTTHNIVSVHAMKTYSSTDSSPRH